MGRFRLSITLVVVLLVSACTYMPGVQLTWTSQQALDAIKQAQLPLTNVQVSQGGALNQADVVDTAVFQIPSGNEEATGNIFAFASAAEAEQYNHTNPSSAFSTPSITLLVFTHNNLHVMLFGKVPGSVLEQYRTAIQSLR